MKFASTEPSDLRSSTAIVAIANEAVPSDTETTAPSLRGTPLTIKSISVGAGLLLAVSTVALSEYVIDVAPVPLVNFSAVTAAET